ncbi:GlsB/YeaQ/YmgE family stress response membrane protein [Nevskia sp.]|uniref:GlsB/YeaQ/YmgE family stress response membrane protein n=1 Tax=Nevskia sp. TaxID=1929292 RepID=UPI0025F28199|nr:GlsB/YeaQ/YmgE family stress response membrane protein [Nevskia sp.]
MIWTLFIGFVVGLVARYLKPGNDGMGIILTTVLGIAGSFVASYGGQALGLYRPGQGAGFLGALIGAIVLLYVVGAIRSKQGS